MAYSYKEFPDVDGATNLFGFSFGYLDAAHIQVYVDGVEDTAFTWNNSQTVQTSFMPTAGSTVIVRRSTPKDNRLVDFEDGSMLTEANLDKDANHLFFVMQEALDGLVGLIYQDDADGKFDAQNKALKNVAGLEGAVVAALEAYETACAAYDTTASESASQAATAEAAALGHKQTAESEALAAANSASQAAAQVPLCQAEVVKCQDEVVNCQAEVVNAQAIIDTADVALDQNQEFTKVQNYDVVAPAATSGTVTLDCANDGFLSFQLTGNVSFGTPNNMVDGRCGMIRVQQGAGGYTVSFDVEWRWHNGITPAIDGTVNSQLWISWMVYNGSIYASVFHQRDL